MDSGAATHDGGDVFALPTGLAKAVVRRYEAHSFSGLPAGVHRGLPSRALTFRFSLGEPTEQTSVEEVAAHVGWSRRHLASRFKTEVGLTPKALGRIVRFEHACELLLHPKRSSLADVAAVAGCYDQSHLTREWSELADCTPTAWLAEELHDPPRLDAEFPFVQDAGRLAG